MSIPAKTLADLEWSRIQEALATRCHTVLGDERARALFPELQRPLIERDLAATDELRGLHESSDPPSFGAIRDLRPKLSHAEKGGVLENSDLIEFAEHLGAASLLRRFLLNREERAKTIAGMVREMPDLLAFADAVSRCFDETGRLKDSASPDLGHLRATANRLAEQLKKTITRLLGDSRVSTFLQDSYYTVRDDRYVLPVRSDSRAEVKGIVHGTSGSGATLFIEPEEMVDLGNRYKIALAAVEREEQRILAELTGQVVQRAAAIRQVSEQCGELDLLNAKARLSSELDLSTPKIEPETGDLELVRARHPGLLLQGVKVISNDIELTRAAKVLVISGPNTGGKTISMKTAGLCALFLRAGIPIPADRGSRLPLYRSVYTDIGDEQSVERNLSTFSARMLNTLDIMKRSGPGDLVLLDEIAAGTEPSQGAALACAVLEDLARANAHVLSSTHYDLPKTLALSNRAFANASVGFDAENLAPTYRLHLGIPGRSSALEVATRLGAPPSLIERARGLLSTGGRAFEDILAQLERDRDALDTERRRMERARQGAEQTESVLKERLEKLKIREKGLISGTYEGLLRTLAEARTKVEQANKRLHERQEKHPNDRLGQEAMVRQAREALSQAEIAERRAAERFEEERRKQRERAKAQLQDLTPGRSVFISSLNTEGTIEEAPDEKGRVRVRVGTLKTQVTLEDLMIQQAPNREQRRVKEAVQRQEEWIKPAPVPLEPPPMTSDITLDLRGARVDEALLEADSFLDQMLQRDRNFCFMIHGHGTGALKQALREFLKQSPLVAEIRPGERHHGGDGITIVRIA
jgi:DNA mismatch repair protein MutS2